MSEAYVGSRATRSGAARNHWICGPTWDLFWLQSALWLMPLALLLAYGHDDPGESPLDWMVFGLTALFWIGHRLGSAWLALGFSTGFLHYWLDRAVYRLAHPGVRVAARGLL